MAGMHLLAAITAFLVVAPAAAQDVTPDRGSRQTREYVEAAGQSDAFEMLEADTVLAQSRDPQVRAFAQKMIDDHARLAQSLRQATAEAGTKAPPMGVAADQAPMLGALQNLKGRDFDQAYWRHQALAHRSALTATQRYAASGDDPAVRRAATAAVPVISAHLATAERVVAGFGGG